MSLQYYKVHLDLNLLYVCKIPRGSSDLHTDFNIFIIFDKVKDRQIVCPEG